MNLGYGMLALASIRTIERTFAGLAGVNQRLREMDTFLPTPTDGSFGAMITIVMMVFALAASFVFSVKRRKRE